MWVARELVPVLWNLEDYLLFLICLKVELDFSVVFTAESCCIQEGGSIEFCWVMFSAVESFDLTWI